MKFFKFVITCIWHIGLGNIDETDAEWWQGIHGSIALIVGALMCFALFWIFIINHSDYPYQKNEKIIPCLILAGVLTAILYLYIVYLIVYK